MRSPRYGDADERDTSRSDVGDKERERERERERVRGPVEGQVGRTRSLSFEFGLKGIEKAVDKVPDKGEKGEKGEKGVGKGVGKAPEKGKKGTVQVVPCWLLINLSHSSQPDGDIHSGTATTCMRVRNIY